MRPPGSTLPAFMLALLVAVAAAPAAMSQSVEGRIRDATTGDPLPGVNVLLRGTSTGASTDQQGRYRIPVPEPGQHEISARFLGYEEIRRTVEVPDGSVTLNILLPREIVPMAEVDVVAERLQAQADPQPSRVQVEPAGARALAGAGEDVLRALHAVPGVVATSDYTTRLVVRGGGPDENLIMLDDVEIFNPYRLYGVVSAFNPVVVSEIDLLTGGFPARFGDRLSSVLSVQLREGTRHERFAGSVNTSISNANIVLEGRTGWGNGSWLLTGRRTYYDLILGPIAKSVEAIDDNVSFPNFADIQGKLVLRPAPGHLLQFNSIFSRDALDIGISGMEGSGGSSLDRIYADDLSRNDLLTGAWHWALSPNALSKVVVSWYRNSGVFGSDGRFVPRDRLDGNQLVASADTVNTLEFGYDQQFLFRKMSAHNQWAVQWGPHLLEGGAGLDLLTTTLRFDLWLNDVARTYFDGVQNHPMGPGAFPEQFDQSKNYYRYHAFLQNRLNLFGDRLVLQPGLRYDYYRVISRAYLSPRFNFALSLTPSTTLRGAWGVYRQSPGFEKLLDRGQIFDLSREAGIDDLRAETATHYVLGISQWLDDRYLLRVEGYNKSFRDLIVQQQGVEERWEAIYRGGAPRTSPRAYDLRLTESYGLLPVPHNDSDGRAYGVELSVEKRRSGPEDRLSGWISYAYANAHRSRSKAENPNVAVRVPLDYDRRHVANLVIDYRIGRRWHIGATWRFGTGFPFTPAIDYRPVVVTRIDLDDPDAEPVVEILTDDETGLARFAADYGDEENVNSDRYPDYHRLDLRVTRHTRLFGMDWQFYLDVINVYNRTNIFRYREVVIVDSDHPNREPVVAREQISMFPLLPSIGFSFEF